MARKSAAKGNRLPSGLYAWKGKAVPFGKLPKKARQAWRQLWSTKAAKSSRKRQRTAEAETAVITVGKIRGERMGGARADVEPPGWEQAARVSRVLAGVVREGAGRARPVSWYARLRWPEDHPRGRQRETMVSIGFTNRMEFARADFVRYLGEIQESGGAILREKSGGKGKPEIIELGAMTPGEFDDRDGDRADARAELRGQRDTGNLGKRAVRLHRGNRIRKRAKRGSR